VDSAPDVTRGATQRVRLARAALAAVRGHPDVVGVHAGVAGLGRTRDDGSWLVGVNVIADSDGTYSVALHVVVRVVALHALSVELVELVRQAAAERGLEPVLGAVAVVFEDIAEDRT
jgi:hypothetical protein